MKCIYLHWFLVESWRKESFSFFNGAISSDPDDAMELISFMFLRITQDRTVRLPSDGRPGRADRGRLLG